MFWDAKTLATTLLVLFSLASHARTLSILAVGAPPMQLCHVRVGEPTPGIFWVDEHGQKHPASMPNKNSPCGAADAWIPLGQRLIESGQAEKVEFSLAGQNAESVLELLQQIEEKSKAPTSPASHDEAKINFDYALWMLGVDREKTSPSEYSANLWQAIDKISRTQQIELWLIASYNGCQSKPWLIEKQREVGKFNTIRRFLGPRYEKSLALSPNAQCKLNELAAVDFAGRWAKRMDEASKRNQEIQSETMLHWFRKLRPFNRANDKI